MSPPPLWAARKRHGSESSLLPSSRRHPASARVLTQAPDTEDGARVFAYVCSACHLGGYNQVRAERTLQEAVLRENGMLAADAIEYQVVNGKNRMPAFENRRAETRWTRKHKRRLWRAARGLWRAARRPWYESYSTLSSPVV